MLKMVLRIFGSKICRPSKFHKPKAITSYRQKSTSSDQRDEVAKRQQYQKVIDYVFGPPRLHELDNIKVAHLAEKEDGVILMERPKENPLHTKTDGTLGHVRESVQNKVLPQKEATVGTIDTQAEQNSPRQGQREESVVRATAGKDKAKKDNILQKTLPSLDVEAPNYYRQMEAQMYDNYAKKYLKTEPEQIDNLLAKDMENLEHPLKKSLKKSDDADPVTAPNLRAVDTPTEKAEPQTFYTGHSPLCQQGSRNLEPRQKVDDMTTATSVEENVDEVYTSQSYTNAHYDELVPLNLTQCLDFYQMHSVPESNVINAPIENFNLDENLPTHFVLPATIVNDNGAEWTDVSQTIKQPIGRPYTIYQFRAQPGPSGPPSCKAGAQTDETKKPAEVTYKTVNIQIKPTFFQEQSNPLTKMNLIEANVSEHTETSKGSCVQAQMANEQIIAQPAPSTQAKQEQVMSDNVAQQVGTHRIMEDRNRIRGTDTIVQSCVHAQTSPSDQKQSCVHTQFLTNSDHKQTRVHAQIFPSTDQKYSCVHTQVLPSADQKAKSAHLVDDVITDFHVDPKLSLSEVLKRVRTYNRLQYCKEIGMQTLHMTPVISSKRCPPSDRPQGPPPPDCVKKCPPPPKKKPKCPKCPKCPECPPAPKCPPPQPKCPPDPPKCPSTCPPPKKCPDKCGYQSIDPHDPITVAPYGRLSLTTPCSGNFKEYMMEKINQGLVKLRGNSLDSVVFMVGPKLEAEILQLNRVKDFEPWSPIPSWPYPLEDNKRKLQCPHQGCPVHKPVPVTPPCPPMPCTTFPKRRSFSSASPL